MGQKVNPVSFRLGYIQPWQSNWVADKKTFSSKLKDDYRIRKLIEKNIPFDIISKITMERTLTLCTVTIFTHKPGIIIGAGGDRVQDLSSLLRKKIDKSIQINIQEVRRPEVDASIVARGLAEQIKRRVHYKRAISMVINNAMRLGAQGVKISISGRLNGIEIARTEVFRQGRTPMHTLRAEIDYSVAEACTLWGVITLKVAIFKKEVHGKRDLSIKIEPSKKSNMKRNRFSRSRS